MDYSTQWEEPEEPEVHWQQSKATASTESERGRIEIFGWKDLGENDYNYKGLKRNQKNICSWMIWQDLSLPQNSEASHRGAILVRAMFTKDIPAYGILMYATQCLITCISCLPAWMHRVISTVVVTFTIHIVHRRLKYVQFAILEWWFRFTIGLSSDFKV